jgi:hypothetical protein
MLLSMNQSNTTWMTSVFTSISYLEKASFFIHS